MRRSPPVHRRADRYSARIAPGDEPIINIVAPNRTTCGGDVMSTFNEVTMCATHVASYGDEGDPVHRGVCSVYG